MYFFKLSLKTSGFTFGLNKRAELLAHPLIVTLVTFMALSLNLSIRVLRANIPGRSPHKSLAGLGG
jgi:hypothetical protein